jgi:putative transposon-encoded protein
MIKSPNRQDSNPSKNWGNVKFEVYGEEMFEKTVAQSGKSGRVYLPHTWVGCRVKVIRTD